MSLEPANKDIDENTDLSGVDIDIENENAGADEEGAGEVVVSIGDAPVEEEEEEDLTAAPAWVLETRKANKEHLKKIRELERNNKELNSKLSAVSGAEVKVPALGKRPQLSDDDINYDEDTFVVKTDAWLKLKAEVEKAEADKTAQAEKAGQEWQSKLDGYTKSKTELKVKDFDDAESVVLDSLSQMQQSIIVSGADNSAILVYALGKNPDKTKELAAIKDPVKFAFAVAKLESQLKVSKRTPTTKPETTLKPNTTVSGGIDKALDRLRADAEKTGDYSKVVAHKKQLRNK